MWTEFVPLISDGQQGNATTFNSPLQALIDRTAYLKQQLDSLTNKSNVIQFGVPIKSDVVVGDLVYYNSTTNQFEKAQAVWSNTYDVNGELQISPKAYVKGLVIATQGGTGDLLLSGEYESATVTAYLFTIPGDYFLSEVAAGKVDNTPPSIRIPVLSYQGGNTFTFNQTAVPALNHTHKAFSLSAGWLDITDPAFDGMDIPGAAVKGYDISSDSNIADLFATYHGEAKVFNDGILLGTDRIVINEDNIWWMTADVPQGVFTLYTYIPFLNGEPILRTASSNTPEELIVSAKNGHVQVDAKPWTVSADVSPVPTAVASITDKVIRKTPVITSVAAGSGAHVTVTSLGRAVVSLDNSMEALLDGDIVDLNNSLQYSDAPFILFNFPASRESSIIYRVKIPKMSSLNSYVASAWATRHGMTGGTVPSPVKYPSITVSMTFVPHPGNSYVDLGTLTTVSTSLQEFDSVQGRLYFHETPTGSGRIAVTSEGTLYVTMTAGASAGDKIMSRFGAKIYVV